MFMLMVMIYSTFDQVGQWSEACESIGIPVSDDMYGGSNWGAEVSTSCINPSNWTRSYSRTGYLDPLPDRGNYDVLANAHVTRILFDSSDNLTANAVEYTSDDGKTKNTVNVTKEVILAAGSVGSPAVLLHSGVGPKDILSDAGVDLVYELPGVGQHLQDHFVRIKFIPFNGNLPFNAITEQRKFILMSTRALLSNTPPTPRQPDQHSMIMAVKG